MKRPEINTATKTAASFFEKNSWALPPDPKWDITDFGLRDFQKFGLILINLAEEAEYCEKLMYAAKGQTTPAHYHKNKKEDIICRNGTLIIQFWLKGPDISNTSDIVGIKVNGKYKAITSGDKITLQSGERVTIIPGIWHEFYPGSDECIIGEVSTANDDVNDNFFANLEVGRFSAIEEDMPASQ